MESLARAGAAFVVAATLISAPIAGTFALLGGKPMVAAEMTATRLGGPYTLDIVQTPLDGGKPITNYTLDMTKLMHLIIVSDDFTEFFHVHPAFDAKTGHFTIEQRLDPLHRYYAYADSQPTGMSQQVFRFTIQPGPNATNNVSPFKRPSPVTADAGPYTVTLAKTTLPANTMQMIDVNITRNGTPATDLKPYLGAAAHAVFINTSSLQYVHVHPMVQGAHASMSDMHMSMPMNDDIGMGKAGPKLMMHVPPLPAGIYRLWLQFQGGSTLQVAAFTIVAR